MNTKYIVGLIVAVLIIGGGIFFFTSRSNSNPPVPPIPAYQNQATENNSSNPSPVSTSSKQGNYKVVGGSSKKYPSPDGNYVAILQSDEQGNSGISITNSNGDALTPTYCGFYDSWNADSKKVKVLLPPECGYSQENEYYYLDINGTREPVEGSTFVPNAQ
jgi:hypothetical protein